jgi:hypothetical protein
MLRISEPALLLALLAAATAVETNAAASASELEAAIADCRSITTATGRLDCYDAIKLGEELAARAAASTKEMGEASGSDDSAAALAAAATATAVVVAVDEPPSEEEKFGFEFDVKDALQSVTSDVTEVRKNAKGGLVLTLANGQIWQQSDGQTLFMDEGDSVTITRGALSAFYLTRDGKGRRYKFARAQ